MKSIGEKTEAIVLAELIKRDIPVSLPFGDNQRYDMIMEIDGILYKIQIKTGNFKEDTLSFNACSSSLHRKNGKKKSYEGQIDYFITYCYEIDKMYLIDVNKVGKTEVCLRLNETKNNQKSRVRMARDYDFDSVLAEIKTQV